MAKLELDADELRPLIKTIVAEVLAATEADDFRLNGRLAYPVHEVTIAGNLAAMRKDIQMIGNDLTFLGSVASPTLKLGNLVVSGE